MVPSSKIFWLLPAVFLLSLLYLVGSDAFITHPGPARQIPPHFPPLPVPADNELTAIRIALGKKLFFDPLLSQDSSLSCGSCHRPEAAFADPRTLSLGVDGKLGKRNAPSLVNAAYLKALNWDGGVPSLELQALVPLHSGTEMALEMKPLLLRLRQHPSYPALFRQAFGRQPENSTLLRALAAYLRTLVGGTSRYDRFLQGDSLALSDLERQGLALFKGKANCAACHSGLFLTDGSYRNNGLSVKYLDPGRIRASGNPDDTDRFRVPSLRNTALTAPYMHNGSLPTLESVIEHYASGGAPHPNKDSLLRPILLTNSEKKALLAFLHTLTDEGKPWSPKP